MKRRNAKAWFDMKWFLIILSLFQTTCSAPKFGNERKKQFVSFGTGGGGNLDSLYGTDTNALPRDGSLGDLGDDDALQQMHITENNMGGISLGGNQDENSLASLLGGNSLSSLGGETGGGLEGNLGGLSLSSLENSLKDSAGATGAESFASNSDSALESLNDNAAGLGSLGENNKQLSLSALLGTASNLAESLGGGSENSETKDLDESTLNSFTGGDNSLGGGDFNGGDSLAGLNFDQTNNVENKVNLGDSLANGVGDTDLIGLSQSKLAALLGEGSKSAESAGTSSTSSSSSSSETSASLAAGNKGNKAEESAKLQDGLGALQKLLAASHATGGDRQGIGFGEPSDMLSQELGQLDMSDEKLQQMLEHGLGVADALAEHAPPPPSGPSADAQPSEAPDETPAMNFNDGGGDYGGGLASLGGPPFPGIMSMSPLHFRPGQTVHAHASDKPSGTDEKTSASPDVAAQNANERQKEAQREHKEKLVKLKHRLKDLREKLSQLEAEQAKKSHNLNNPAAKRKDAIKKLLIKNLKLAAMIATKEIQLEEAKASAFTGSNSSSRKEDDSDIAGIEESILSASKTPEQDSKTKDDPTSKAKPLTELSKKAEDEVNHLGKSQGQSTQNKTSKGNNIFYTASATTAKADNSSIIKQINATLNKLSASSPDSQPVSPRAFKRLVKQMTQMSPMTDAIQEAEHGFLEG